MTSTGFVRCRLLAVSWRWILPGTPDCAGSSAGRSQPAGPSTVSQDLGFRPCAHHCVGAALARMELQEAMALLTRSPGLRVSRRCDMERRMLVRGPITMPVAWAND